MLGRGISADEAEATQSRQTLGKQKEMSLCVAGQMRKILN